MHSLLLCPPGGSLLAEATPDLRAFFEAEQTALARGDLDGAVEANLTWWVVGLHRAADDVDPAVLESVRKMQRRVFGVTAAWGDVEEEELDPPALDRLPQVRASTLVVVGALDLDTVHDAARRVTGGIADAALVDWQDTAHLPSMERPTDFFALLDEWLR